MVIHSRNPKFQYLMVQLKDPSAQLDRLQAAFQYLMVQLKAVRSMALIESTI